jgi:hypothetical protein
VLYEVCIIHLIPVYKYFILSVGTFISRCDTTRDYWCFGRMPPEVVTSCGFVADHCVSVSEDLIAAIFRVKLKFQVLKRTFWPKWKEVTRIMDAASTSETSVDFYLSARRSIPKDSHLHTHRCENRKPHGSTAVCMFILYGTWQKYRVSRVKPAALTS